MELAPSSERSLAAEARWLLGWATMWLATFGVFVALLSPAGFGMYGRSWVGGLWYASAALTGAWLLRRELRAEQTGVDWGRLPEAGLLLTLLGVAACAAWAQSGLPLSPETRAAFEREQLGFVRLDQVYFAVKLPELCFQQTLIYALVRRIQSWGRRGPALIATFALVFAAVHLPILAFKGAAAGLSILGASAAAGLLFVPLIAGVRRGVCLSFCVHLTAYLVAGLLARA